MPLGVVGGIIPWNFPVLLALWKVAPALITGNTFVLKPTPLTALRFGEIAQRVLPAGVLSVVSGGNELGPQLTNHPDIAKISFTRSTKTGPATLELGGNDAALVLPDADYKGIIPQLFWGGIRPPGPVVRGHPGSFWSFSINI